MSDSIYPHDGFLVQEDIEGATKLEKYTLYPGDLIVHGHDGNWRKEAPGLCVGVTLTEEQIAKLKPVKFGYDGLEYWVEGETP